MPQEVIINKPQQEQSVPLPEAGNGKKIPLSMIESSIHRIIGGAEQDPYRAETRLRQLTELIGDVLSVDRPDGSQDDYHNLAVNLTRDYDLYGLACDVLEKGMQIYPYEPDLMGDYLAYGVNCGRIEQCQAVYKSLRKIPFTRWTWRAFTFSITSYLRYCRTNASSAKEEAKLLAEMQELIARYHEMCPFSEQAWSCEADVYKMFNDPVREAKALEDGLEALGDAAAPRCAMRLSKIRYQQGNRTEALALIRRAVRDNAEENETVSAPYLRFLEGLIRYSIAVSEEPPFPEEQCERIFTAFNAVLDEDPHFARAGVIRSKTKAILSETHRPLDEKKYAALADLLRRN